MFSWLDVLPEFRILLPTLCELTNYLMWRSKHVPILISLTQ